MYVLAAVWGSHCFPRPPSPSLLPQADSAARRLRLRSLQAERARDARPVRRSSPAELDLRKTDFQLVPLALCAGPAPFAEDGNDARAILQSPSQCRGGQRTVLFRDKVDRVAEFAIYHPVITVQKSFLQPFKQRAIYRRAWTFRNAAPVLRALACWADLSILLNYGPRVILTTTRRGPANPLIIERDGTPSDRGIERIDDVLSCLCIFPTNATKGLGSSAAADGEPRYLDSLTPGMRDKQMDDARSNSSAIKTEPVVQPSAPASRGAVLSMALFFFNTRILHRASPRKSWGELDSAKLELLRLVAMASECVRKKMVTSARKAIDEQDESSMTGALKKLCISDPLGTWRLHIKAIRWGLDALGIPERAGGVREGKERGEPGAGRLSPAYNASYLVDRLWLLAALSLGSEAVPVQSGKKSGMMENPEDSRGRPLGHIRNAKLVSGVCTHCATTFPQFTLHRPPGVPVGMFDATCVLFSTGKVWTLEFPQKKRIPEPVTQHEMRIESEQLELGAHLSSVWFANSSDNMLGSFRTQVYLTGTTSAPTPIQDAHYGGIAFGGNDDKRNMYSAIRYLFRTQYCFDALWHLRYCKPKSPPWNFAGYQRLYNDMRRKKQKRNFGDLIVIYYTQLLTRERIPTSFCFSIAKLCFIPFLGGGGGGCLAFFLFCVV
ncbi:hypothetical protein CCUS01_16933 [Colletotrichum cuscutae]|uniref:Uncharacterized protein n=1 Tax=Colletotrichum cuscutae TaxID=1209917 RepID=A0AAI9VA16_9PEZI|nr:hypothetical protein CCUS01_16933 [Colletotrichum cuscutae]